MDVDDGDEQETLEEEVQNSEDDSGPDEDGSEDLEDNEQILDPKIHQLELLVSTQTCIGFIKLPACRRQLSLSFLAIIVG